MPDKELVDKFENILDNAKNFKKELHNSQELQKKLSEFHQWYYFNEYDIFAPSKYIGYKNNSAEKYLLNYEKRDGRETEKVLKKTFVTFFHEIDKEDNDYKKLDSKLKDFLSLYNKKPRKNYTLNKKI